MQARCSARRWPRWVRRWTRPRRTCWRGRLAATIDAMPPAVAVPMLPNHAGPLVKVLTELDARYRRRSAGREPGAPADCLERLEAAGSAGNGGAPAAGPYWWQGRLKEALQLGRT